MINQNDILTINGTDYSENKQIDFFKGHYRPASIFDRNSPCRLFVKTG